jgi:serine/threonine protein kinase
MKYGRGSDRSKHMSQDPRIGTEVGPYRIEALLGRGGMGFVYLAHHARLDRKVALKILAPEWSEDPSFRDRFVSESRTAASLDHPNVIPVYDADETDGLLYIAMRYVEGNDLKQIISSEGALDLERIVRIMRQISGALDAAHERGLVHRDVKPANVLVSQSDGRKPEHVYLTDFGLTKHRSSNTGHTATGAFVGTIDYIAPEQIEGKKLDNRTDVYSLACVLFECLTGQIPFKKDADVAVMYAHLMDERPSVTATNPQAPAALDPIVAKAMARDPDERYPSASALMEDIDAALGTGASQEISRVDAVIPELVTPEPDGDREDAADSDARPRRGSLIRRAASLGLIAVVAAAGLFFAFAREDDEKTNGNRRTATPPERVVVIYIGERGWFQVPLGTDEGPQPISDLLPDAGGLEDLYITISRNGKWALLDTEREGCKDHSCYVVVNAQQQTLEKVMLGPQTAHGAGSAGGAISFDGNTLVLPSDEGPHEVDLWITTRAKIGWNAPVLLTQDSEHAFNEAPKFSVGNGNILFDCHPEVYDPVRGDICEVGVDGTGLRVAVDSSSGPGATKKSHARHGTYAPDGAIVFEAFWGGFTQVWRQPPDGSEPAVLNPLYDGDMSPCVTPEGDVVSVHDNQLKVMTLQGEVTKLIDLGIAKNEYADNRLSCG